jgi:hypothetical protein
VVNSAQVGEILFLASSELGVVMQDHIQQRMVHLHVSVIIDEPELAELVHEEAHA